MNLLEKCRAAMAAPLSRTLFVAGLLLAMPVMGPVAMAVVSALALIVCCFVLKFSSPVVRAGFIAVTVMMVMLAGYGAAQFLRGQWH